MNEQEIKDLQFETIDRLQKRIKELEEEIKDRAETEASLVLQSVKATDRIKALEEAGRELLIEAMNLYHSRSVGYRKPVEQYFSDEIRMFNYKEKTDE